MLQQVFGAFDLDQSGQIESSELLQLGKARRAQQNCQQWTEQQNIRLVKQMDLNRDGLIDQAEFVAHFDRALPSSSVEFEALVDQFLRVARACSARKQRLQSPIGVRSPPSASSSR